MIESGDNIDPGTVVLLIMDYTLGSSSEVVAVNTFINYNSDNWTPIYDSTDTLFYYSESSLFPAPTRKQTAWTFEMSIPEEGTIKVLSSDIVNYLPLKTDMELGYVFMKLNDDVAAGQSTTLSFKTEGAKMSDASGVGLEYTTSDMTLSVYGAESQDASLKTLTVTNGSTTYPLDPTFTPGDATNKTYYTVVPNNISSIDLAATVNDEYAEVLPGGLGSKDLNVGDNVFDITVSSQLGNTETYQVHVYRLSNDATLSSLSLTNGVSIGDLEDGVYTYTATIPYKISNTNVTVVTNHENAYVESGIDNWELTNSGTTLNTKSIIVKAENCLDEYSEVEGNACSSQTYTLEITREAASENNYLSSLTVDGVSVPNFDKETTEYTLDNVATTKSQMTIAAVVEDTDKATIQSGTGTVELSVGDNSFDVVVKAENGITKTYTIKVRRLSNNVNLSGLTVTSSPEGTLSPDFTSSFYGTYTYTYDPTVTNVSITATVEDTGKAKIALADISTDSTAVGTSVLNTATESYSVSTTKVAVTVTAEDGTVQTYPINLTRLKSSNNYLSSLSLSEGTLSPEFNSTTRTYTASVDGSVEAVEVYATPAVTYGKVVSITGNESLDFGLNTIEVVVEAENGDQSSYIINLTREKYTIATLDDLKINGTTIAGFDKDTFEYTLNNVDFETDSLNIETTKTNSYATVSGDGDIELKTGDNEIVITVLAQDGVTKNEYIINIYREKNDDNTVHGLTVAGKVPTLNDEGYYEVTLPNGKDTLNPSDVIVSASDDATVNKGESISLSTKNVNTYQFTITSENNETETYTILVTREPSDDTSISRVTLTIGEDSSRYCLMESSSCTIAVPVETTNFSLNASIHDEASVSPVNGTNYEMPANESTKNVELTVTAEDGSTEVYTVVVERQKSSNANLKSLYYNGISVTGFTASKQTYNEVVAGTVETALITAEVEDTGKAKITTDLTNAFNLDFGNNTIEVEVEAENGNTKTYTIIINRKNRVDATLKDLTINGTTISGFSSEITSYVLSDLDYNTHQLRIVATPNDELATKNGDGLIDLSTGENEITITVTAHDTSVTQPYTIKVNRKLNSNANIDGITLAGVEATYNSDKNKYEVTVPNSVDKATTSNLIVDVNDPIVSTDKEATYTFTDTNLLTTQDNEIVITVTAEDGTVKTYTLVVTREKSDVATLNSLTVTNGSFNPSFKTGTFEYEVTVPVDTTEFDVSAVLTDENANITSGVGHYTLSESTKKIEVVVVSENLEVTKTYTLNIVRTKSSVNTLSGITLSEGTLDSEFNSDTTSYTVNVSGSVDSINIGATLTDDRATIESGTGDHELNVGDNPITIRVKSEAGSYLDYTINVVRAKKEDNNLTSLTVDGVSVPNFDKDTLEYTLDDVLYSKTSIEIGAVLSDTDATIVGTGRKGLKTGENKFEIVVTAQNGTPKTYIINITRAKNNNANLSLLAVNGYALVPSFDSEIYDYEVTVDETKETLSPNEITAVSEDTNATVVKQETISLSTTVDNYYEVKVTAEDGVTTETYTIKVIRPKSSDATLSKVNVTGANVTPTFDPSKTEYTLTVPYGSTDFSIEGIPNVGTTKVFGNGDYTISNNVVTITTQAEDGTIGTYNFTVVEALSNDATLSGLSVTGYPLDKNFISTSLSYTIGNVPYGTEKLIINATANNLNSTVEYYVDGLLQDSNIVNIPDAMGGKTITVKVTAPDGVKTMSYNISYTLVPSSNAYLSSLVPSIGTIEFIKTTDYYEITVDNDVTSINFDITTEDENASITVNNESSFTPKTVTISDLVVGNNPVSILVTAQDGTTTKTYNVMVKRLEPVASNDATLSALSVNNYELDKNFDMDVEEYSIGAIPFSLTELTINATPNMGASTVNYLVNGVKQSGNVVTVPKVEGAGAITVQVTAEDGKTVKNYKITYTKTASTNAYLSNIIVSNGNLVFNKNTFAYTVDVDRTVSSIDITAITEDSTATMQMNGTTYTSPHTLTISPLNSGETEITTIITSENGNVLTYKVVVNKEADPASTITSVNYGHSITNGYIKTVKLTTTAIEMKNQLDNENEYLEIWTADESSIVGDNDRLATGMIVKLMIDGEEKDRKIIVIKGDTSGDGEIDLFDSVKILNHYLVRTPLTGAYLEAAYVNADTEVDLFDSVMILNHYLGKSSLH